MLLGCAGALFVPAAPAAELPRAVSFATADGGTVVADLYGADGRDAVVLAHGAAFDKASWRPLATELVGRGFQVLAIDFRGYGQSQPGTKPDGLYEDVLGAVRDLRRRGAPRVLVVGASMGGAAAARAASEAAACEIDRLVLLAPAPVAEPERIKGPTLFIASEHEPGLARVREQFARAPEPKRLVLLPGAAHAQHVLATDQAERLTATIAEFLSER